MPGIPSHAGRVTESSLAVQIRPVGTAFWKRNHSVPGVQSRFQYSRGMVGENLDTGADNERHEKQVEEVQQPEPNRKSRGDGNVGGRNARVAHEKILHRWKFPQCLGNGHADHQEHENQEVTPIAR